MGDFEKEVENENLSGENAAEKMIDVTQVGVKKRARIPDDVLDYLDVEAGESRHKHIKFSKVEEKIILEKAELV